MKRLHKHLSVCAYNVKAPPVTREEVESWVRRLCKEGIDMDIVAGPTCYYAESEINRGWTCTAIIEFSDVSIHIWELEGLIEVDVFSCKWFDETKVFEMVEEFKPDRITYDLKDRQKDFREYQL